MKTEYTIVNSGYDRRSGKSFTEEVNEKLAEGWKCQGGVSIAFVESMMGGFEKHYAQAMIREVED